MADPKTPTPARPKAPGPDVVEALANSTAAGSVAVAIEMARAAYERELTGLSVPAPEGTAARPLTLRDKWDLAALKSHPAQLVTATTVPAAGPS